MVTRYFGGIKLGAGGLIRAYSHATVLGIEKATVIQMTPFIELAITINYDLLATLEHWLRQEKIRTNEAEYADNVTLKLLIPPESITDTIAAITDITSDRFSYKKGAAQLIALPL